MHIDIFTLFPEMFAGPLTESILKRAQQAGLLRIDLHDIRDWTTNKHHTADGTCRQPSNRIRYQCDNLKYNIWQSQDLADAKA